jgi:hypothetical protein
MLTEEQPLDHARIAEILGSEDYRVLTRDESLELQRLLDTMSRLLNLENSHADRGAAAGD